MKKIIMAGLVAGLVLLLLSIPGLYITIWLFPDIALEYFNPAFDSGSNGIILYFLHPFIISLALSFFWAKFKSVLTGSFLARGIEFGLIYVMVSTFPMMWLIYSSMHVSLAMIVTWFFLALLQGVIAGLVFEKLNP